MTVNKSAWNRSWRYFVKRWPDFVQLFMLLALFVTIREALRQTELTRSTLRMAQIPYVRIYGFKLESIADASANSGLNSMISYKVSNESESAAINCDISLSGLVSPTLQHPTPRQMVFDLIDKAKGLNVFPHVETTHRLGFSDTSLADLIHNRSAILVFHIEYDDLFGNHYAEDVTIQGAYMADPETNFHTLRTELEGHFLELRNIEK